MEEINGNVENQGNDNRGKRPRIHSSRTPKQEEELSEVIERRNKRLAAFFKTLELPVRIIGDDNNPAMIYDDKFVINAYVHNFELRFTDNPIGGNVIYTVKLTGTPNLDKQRVLECINNYPVRNVSKIFLKNTNPILYLSGYNFLNKNEKLGKYPVFSAYNPKVYFTEERANQIIEELKIDGYNCDSM